MALASISLPTFDAVKRSILHKFPETTKVGIKSGLLAYEEKNQPADPSTNPTQLKVVYGVVTMSDVLNGVVSVKDGFSFARNLVIQLRTKLNLARATEIRRLEGTGKSVYNPRWREPVRVHTNRPSCLVWTNFASMVIINTRALYGHPRRLSGGHGDHQSQRQYHTGTFDPGGVPGERLQETVHVGQIL